MEPEVSFAEFEVKTTPNKDQQIGRLQFKVDDCKKELETLHADVLLIPNHVVMARLEIIMKHLSL
jgi:hypothetical protein